MAGSFNHLVSKDGEFHLDLVRHSDRDYSEALAECWDIIVHLTGGSVVQINAALDALDYPTISADKWDGGKPVKKLKPSRVERRRDGSLKIITKENE